MRERDGVFIDGVLERTQNRSFICCDETSISFAPSLHEALMLINLSLDMAESSDERKQAPGETWRKTPINICISNIFRGAMSNQRVKQGLNSI
mmetsp:Transcript_7383/g.18049  ORF Transcript_7383/g.18049 Transcript_7383/m.18049 type:complete len:93 (-) Transcript_7383:1169-1447(-)